MRMALLFIIVYGKNYLSLERGIVVELTTVSDLSVGDIIEGPDGPELVTDIKSSLISFQGNHCMTVISGREKIVRHIRAVVLKKLRLIP